MRGLYVFLNIKDISINGFVASIDTDTNEYKILHQAEIHSDLLKSESYFLKNDEETEAGILNILQKLEELSGDHLSSVILILPDSCFSINKTALKHDFKFKLRPSALDIFSIKKQSWRHFDSKKGNNEITDIENIAYFNCENNEKIPNIRNELLKEVISVNLVSYLKHDYIEKINTIAKNCNIKTSLIIPTSFAMHHGVLNTSGQDGYLLINISHLESTSCIIGELGIEKFSTIKLGIYSIALEIAKKFNLSTRDANKILKLYLNGLGNIEYSDISGLNITNKPLLNKTILVAIEKLFEIIAKDLSYNPKHFNTTKVIIDGDISRLDYARNLAKDIFDRPTYLVNFDQEIKETDYDFNFGCISKFIKNRAEITEIKNYSSNIKNKLRKLLHAVAFKMDNII